MNGFHKINMIPLSVSHHLWLSTFSVQNFLIHSNNSDEIRDLPTRKYTKKKLLDTAISFRDLPVGTGLGTIPPHLLIDIFNHAYEGGALKLYETIPRIENIFKFQRKKDIAGNKRIRI